jgi:intracellular septation protein A
VTTNPAQSPAQRPAQGPARPVSRQSGMSTALGWAMTIVFNAVLPFLTYDFLVDRGWHQATALVATGVWPLVELGLSYAVRRHVDELCLLVLVFIGLGVVSMLAFNSPRLILVKDSAITGLFGIVTLASLFAPRPLMFYFGRRFATDGSAESAAWWNGLWQYAGFRRTQRVITIVWGVAYLAEAVLRIALTYVLSIKTMVLVTNVLPLVVLAGLIGWTMLYARRARARSAAAAAAAGTPDPAVEPSAS